MLCCELSTRKKGTTEENQSSAKIYVVKQKEERVMIEGKMTRETNMNIAGQMIVSRMGKGRQERMLDDFTSQNNSLTYLQLN